MRLLLTVSAWPGHYFPMVPLAREALAAGHEVRVLCAPSQSGAVQGAGLTPVPVLDGLDMVLQARLSQYWAAQAGNWPYPWLPPHPVTGVELGSLDEFDFPAYRRANRAAALDATRRSFDAGVAFARDWRPDVVVHDRLSLEGLLIGHVLGVPAALHLWGPVGTAEDGALRLLPGDPTGTFPRYGVSELSGDLIGHVIDPCPEALRPPLGAAHRLPVRYVPYHGTTEAVEPLPPPTRPRVCVVWGTSLTAMVGPRSFVVPEILAGLSTVDVEVVALVSPSDADRGTAPPGVRVLPGYPLERALSGASVVVHHGGAGCTMTSLAAGVPQIAVTFAGEQAANGERVAAAGAGRHLPGAEFDPAAVAGAVTSLLHDGSAARVAAELRAQCLSRPAPAELPGRLADLAHLATPLVGSGR
jgi:UDP:flavonoid glycosyltransferase YjiC (YdhE family)